MFFFIIVVYDFLHTSPRRVAGLLPVSDQIWQLPGSREFPGNAIGRAVSPDCFNYLYNVLHIFIYVLLGFLVWSLYKKGCT